MLIPEPELKLELSTEHMMPKASLSLTAAASTMQGGMRVPEANTRPLGALVYAWGSRNLLLAGRGIGCGRRKNVDVGMKRVVDSREMRNPQKHF